MCDKQPRFTPESLGFVLVDKHAKNRVQAWWWRRRTRKTGQKWPQEYVWGWDSRVRPKNARLTNDGTVPRTVERSAFSTFDPSSGKVKDPE